MSIVGAQASYNRTVGVKLDVDEAIQILPVDDVPLQGRISSTPTNSIKVEWLEEDLTPQTFTVTSVTGTGTPWTLVVPDASAVRVGDVYQLQDDATGLQLLVTATDNATGVTVSSFGATTDSDDPAAAQVWELIGQYRAEGVDPESSRSVDRTMPYNYTQWGQEQVEVTRTQQKRAMYGLSDPYGHELMKKFKELAIRYERSMVHGYRTFSGDSTKRFMGGLFYFISTNSRSNTAANVKDSIQKLVRDAWSVGGAPTALMVSPAVKVAISQNIDQSARRSTVDETRGGSVIEKVLTDFGEVDIIVNRYFPKTKGVLMQGEYLKRRVFDGYFHETLAKTGDREHGQIVGESSLEVKNEKAHGILTVTDAA